MLFFLGATLAYRQGGNVLLYIYAFFAGVCDNDAELAHLPKVQYSRNVARDIDGDAVVKKDGDFNRKKNNKIS